MMTVGKDRCKVERQCPKGDKKMYGCGGLRAILLQNACFGAREREKRKEGNRSGRGEK